MEDQETIVATDNGPVERTPNQTGPVVVDLDEDSDDQIERPGCKVKCIRCVRFSLQVLFSYIGLTAVMFGYLLLGTIIFKAIELPKEIYLRQLISDTKKAFLFDLHADISMNTKNNWTEMALFKLNEMERDTRYYFTYDERDETHRWEFFGALLFSLTTVSMIGKYNPIFAIYESTAKYHSIG